MTLPERYAINIETRCWEWCGELSSNGYGRVWLAGKRVAAHRAYYEQEIGPIPAGLQMDHLCRNKRCVNPAHLEPVTNRENQRRARAFNRNRLTERKVASIRSSDATDAELARRYGVSANTIRDARRGITWSEDSRHTYAERRRMARQAAGGRTAEASPAAHDVPDLSGGRTSGRGVVRPMNPPDELPITARLPITDVRKLEKLADEGDRSRSAEVRRAVREYVERHAATATDLKSKTPRTVAAAGGMDKRS